VGLGPDQRKQRRGESGRSRGVGLDFVAAAADEEPALAEAGRVAFFVAEELEVVGCVREPLHAALDRRRPFDDRGDARDFRRRRGPEVFDSGSLVGEDRVLADGREQRPAVDQHAGAVVEGDDVVRKGHVVDPADRHFDRMGADPDATAFPLSRRAVRQRRFAGGVGTDEVPVDFDFLAGGYDSPLFVAGDQVAADFTA
jgi:hypothetical protein